MAVCVLKMMDKRVSIELELEDRIYKLFRDNLSEEFEIMSAQRQTALKRPDITISKNDKRLAIVEVKPGIDYSHHRQEAETQVTNLAYNEGFRYAIIAIDVATFWLKDCFLNKNDVFKKMSFQTICDVFEIIRDPYHVVGKEYRDAVFNKLAEITKGDNDKIEVFKERNRAATFMIDDDTFFFEKDTVEDELFECLLQRFEGEHVCRYTSLASLFRTINEGTQSMCCIVGMNDRSECTYADNYIRDLQGRATLTTKTLYEAEVENRYFILSCMDEKKYDDLTMWRLYGDNTRGVNIMYDVDEKKLNGYKLYHIDYAEQPGGQGHTALNLIGALMGLKVGDNSFKLRKWNEWKHFFKPYEYRDELEIRLLYDKKEKPADKWILTSDYQIACPLVLFKLKDFPLVIEEVKLGPNCPDVEVNQLQLELMIKELRKSFRFARKKGVVVTSNIETYRMR